MVLWGQFYLLDDTTALKWAAKAWLTAVGLLEGWSSPYTTLKTPDNMTDTSHSLWAGSEPQN